MAISNLINGMASREFHDLAELALNSRGQSWGNLGYWAAGEDSYSDACRTLAVHLGEAAKLNSKSEIFDAGFGCGDQLCLWLDHFRVQDVCGINISSSQTQRAKSLLQKTKHGEKSDNIFTADIKDRNKWAEVINDRQITHIIALDCVYHFPSRVDFFGAASSHLKKGGKLALTDFILVDSEPTKLVHRILLWIMFKLSRIPKANMVDQISYKNDLESLGFHSIQIHDISQPVMAGFADWVHRQKGIQLSLFGAIKYRITAAFLNWAYTRSILQYAIVIAEK